MFSEAIAFRRSLTLETNATFMEGHLHDNRCWFMPVWKKQKKKKEILKNFQCRSRSLSRSLSLSLSLSLCFFFAQQNF